MTMSHKYLILLTAGVLCTSAFAADDKVTISKSRLEELERKEAELQKLKGTSAPAPSQATPASTPANAIPAAAPKPTNPPVSSLPAISAGEVVSAPDLAAHYGADPATADLRYGKAALRIRGEVVQIEKRMFQRTYEVVVKTPEAGPGVIFQITAPDNYDSFYTANHGTELFAKTGPTTGLVLRKGQTVLIEGRCKGLKGRMVVVAGRLP